eukprot:3038-Heterococcus_DN1.PRE.4
MSVSATISSDAFITATTVAADFVRWLSVAVCSWCFFTNTLARHTTPRLQQQALQQALWTSQPHLNGNYTTTAATAAAAAAGSVVTSAAAAAATTEHDPQ